MLWESLPSLLLYSDHTVLRQPSRKEAEASPGRALHGSFLSTRFAVVATGGAGAAAGAVGVKASWIMQEAGRMASQKHASRNICVSLPRPLRQMKPTVKLVAERYNDIVP